MANLYVIRYQNGSSSAPLSEDEIKKRILSGELKGNDELSLHPNRFALEVKDFPEFESTLDPHHRKTSTQSRSIEAPPAIAVEVEVKPEGTPARKNRDSFEDDESTQFNTVAGAVPENVKTREMDATKFREAAKPKEVAEVKAAPEPVPMDEFEDYGLRAEKTAEIDRPKELTRKAPKKEKKRNKWVPNLSFLLVMGVTLYCYQEFMEDDEPETARKSVPQVVMTPIRPELPATGSGKPDPERSMKIYAEGLQPYLEDTVRGYRIGVERFQRALLADPKNVKALAMLASSYLNLIESSNKDESTFSVINKLIELSRVNQLDLVETLLAEVEFLAAQRRYDAGITRLTEYAKVTGKFDPALYYYLGWLYSQKGEYGNAMRYLNLIPATALKIPRLYYLRGFLHEENKEFEEADAEYRRAIALNRSHARSLLGLVRVSDKRGELKSQAKLIHFLVANASYQSPKEYVQSLIYQSRLSLLEKKPAQAVEALQSAIGIDPKNEGLRLEYYTLLSTAGKDTKYQKLAQMYALVMEGDRNLKAGKLHEAKTVLLQAQDAFSKSPVPFEKMGDLFYQTGEYNRAVENYKKAAAVDQNAGELAIKMIDALIKNHEWDDAEKALARYRTNPKLKSSVDRLAGDLSVHQGDLKGAVQFYRKAMARDSIDTEVYSSYANVMREVDECRDAQFFYSLALRLDPFSTQAILGSAKCTLKTDGIDAAVSRVQDELAKLPKARADLIAGIAELYSLSREDAKALNFIEQAKEADPEYPETYRVEGDLYLRQLATKKEAKTKALNALKSYAERKPSDPYGHLQRFEIFNKDADFENAQAELDAVFLVSPRFPELHYKRALMYEKMGRLKDAMDELGKELALNPRYDPGFVERGNLFLKANSPDEALKAFIQAMALNPKNAAAKIGAGYANYLKRQYPSALALYSAALVLDKGNPDIHKKMGLAFRDSGDQASARKYFQNYLDLAPDAPDREEFESYKR